MSQKLMVPIPPIQEQEKMTEILSVWDRAHRAGAAVDQGEAVAEEGVDARTTDWQAAIPGVW